MPGEGARMGTPSRSPSLAGIEGSGLREETSPEPRRGELKERRGGGADGGGKSRSWSAGGAAASRAPAPAPPSPPRPRPRRGPPRPRPPTAARRGRPRPAELLPEFRLRLTVRPLPSCPPVSVAGTFPSRIQKGARPLHPEPSPWAPQPPPPPPPQNTAPLGCSRLPGRGNLAGLHLTERGCGCSQLPVCGGGQSCDPTAARKKPRLGGPGDLPKVTRECGIHFRTKPGCWTLIPRCVRHCSLGPLRGLRVR